MTPFLRSWRTFMLPLGVFLCLRIWFAATFPVFNDEAIFLHWGRDIVSGERPWWFPLAHDGKPPMTAVPFGAAQLIPGDPVVLSRLVSVAFSVGTAVLSLATLSIVFPGSGPVPYMWLVAVSPMLVVFGSLALAESAAMFWYALTVYASLRFHARPSYVPAILAGLAVGAGYWWKSTALTGVPVFLACAVFAVATHRPSGRRAVAGAVLGIAAGILVALPLLVPPYSTAIAAGQAKWVFSPAELMALPIASWIANARAVFWWGLGYLTPVVAVAALAGLVFACGRAVRLLAFAAVVPVIAGVLLGRNFTARYVMQSVPFVLLFAAWSFERIVAAWPKAGTVIAIVAIGISATYSALVAIAPIAFFRSVSVYPGAARDFSQYVSGWTSGWGIRDAVADIRRRTVRLPAVILVREDSGNPEDAAFVYGMKERGMLVGYVNHAADYEELRRALPRIPDENWFFLSRGQQYAGLRDRMEEVSRYRKPAPGDTEFVGVYWFVR